MYVLEPISQPSITYALVSPTQQQQVASESGSTNPFQTSERTALVSKCHRLSPITILMLLEEDRLLREASVATTFSHIARTPYLTLSDLSNESLQSIFNFLRTEQATLQHSVHFFANQYQFAVKQIELVQSEQANRTAMKEDTPSAPSGVTSDLNQDAPMADATSSTPSAPVGPSTTAEATA